MSLRASCPGAPSLSQSIPKIPTRTQCEQYRSQLSVRQCSSGGGVTCCAWFECGPCTGFDDPKDDQAAFGKNKNTAARDWQRDTEARLKVLGRQKEDLLASMKAPSTGSAEFDGDYQQMMAKAYGGGAHDNDSSVVRIGAGSDGIPRIPGGREFNAPTHGELPRGLSAERLLELSPEDFQRYLEGLPAGERARIREEAAEAAAAMERRESANEKALAALDGKFKALEGSGPESYAKALFETWRNTTSYGAVAGLAWDYVAGNKIDFEKLKSAEGSVRGDLAKALQKDLKLPAEAASAMIDVAIAVYDKDPAKMAEATGKAAMALADPRILATMAKESKLVADALAKHTGSSGLRAAAEMGAKFSAAGQIVDNGAKAIELVYQAGLVRQNNADFNAAHGKKDETRIRLEETRDHAKWKKENFERMVTQIDQSGG